MISAEEVQRARLRLLKLHQDSDSGHLGGNLSCLEALLCLHHGALRTGDTFVLSKGHSVGAHYVALWSAGLLEERELQTFLSKDGTRLAGHPPTNGLPFAPFATGSLGHGLSLAAGLAKGNLLADKPGHIYCLTSDGEWQEGQSWEALTFAVSHALKNLSILVDHNGLQGFARVSEVDPTCLMEKLRSFGAEVHEVDGHDIQLLTDCLRKSRQHGGQGPHILILRTIKGRGLATEDCLSSHYTKLP